MLLRHQSLVNEHWHVEFEAKLQTINTKVSTGMAIDLERREKDIGKLTLKYCMAPHNKVEL